jgi:hypothetical protein
MPLVLSVRNAHPPKYISLAEAMLFIDNHPQLTKIIAAFADEYYEKTLRLHDMMSTLTANTQDLGDAKLLADLRFWGGYILGILAVVRDVKLYAMVFSHVSKRLCWFGCILFPSWLNAADI